MGLFFTNPKPHETLNVVWQMRPISEIGLKKSLFILWYFAKNCFLALFLQPFPFKMLSLACFLTFLHKIFSGTSNNLISCYSFIFIDFEQKMRRAELFVWPCFLLFLTFFNIFRLWKTVLKNFLVYFFFQNINSL